MPTYETSLRSPTIVTFTAMEAADEDAACRLAAECFREWAASLTEDDFAAKRLPSTPDDSGDARSEARYEYSEHDALDDSLREEGRLGAAEGTREGTEA